MKLFSINTHHAYLNHKIRLINLTENDSIIIKDKFSQIEYVVTDRPQDIRLSAGEHVLYSEDGDISQKENVFIEDGIKLGGGQIRNGFIFDNNPWCFVTVTDRIYIYNIVSQSEFVEYNLTPESILPLNGDYFIFSTKNDYSIFNAYSHCIEFEFQDLVYTNTRIVIYKVTNDIVVYDYIQRKNICIATDNMFSIHGDIMYYLKDNCFMSFNLLTFENTVISEYSLGAKQSEHLVFFQHIAVEPKYTSKNSFAYKIYNLKKNNTIDVEFPIPIRKLGSRLIFDKNKIEDDYNYDRLKQLCKSQYTQVRRDSIAITDLYEIDEDLYCRYEYETTHWVYNGWINGSNNQNRTMNLSSPHPIESSWLSEKVIEQVNKQSSDFTQAKNSGRLLGKSESGNIYLTELDSRIYIYYQSQTSGVWIIKNMDISKYSAAYFSSNGDSIIFKKYGNIAGTFGFEKLDEDIFEIEGFTMPDKVGVNGYLPNWEGNKWGNPVWKDPITLQLVSDLDTKVYRSPDGKYIAKNNFVTEHFDLLTNKVITSNDLQELSQRLNIYNSDKEQREKVIIERRNYINEIGIDIFYKLIESKYPGIRKYILEKNSNTLDEKTDVLIKKRYDENLEQHIKNDNCFTAFFIQRKDYLVYKNVETELEYKVFLGHNVWFLNYVSFSYDSRYLAFAAKFLEGSGVFGLYDLQNEKEVVRYEKTPIDACELNAVWMSLFSKNGDVAFYDSRANAYIMNMNDPGSLRKACGKSVLTFSPSGKYIALSDQNYICGNGHQPSGNVFIHEVNNIDNEVVRYNDIGTNFKNAMRGKSVASVAFSSDEKRLLMVGSDGVIVVRNIQLNNTIELRKTFSIPFFFDTRKLSQEVIILSHNNNDDVKKMFIPIDTQINGYDRIVLSKSAMNYMCNTPNSDINKLRIACLPMPIAIYPPQGKEYQEVYDEVDSSNLTFWGLKYVPDFGLEDNYRPRYSTLNFKGIEFFDE